MYRNNFYFKVAFFSLIFFLLTGLDSISAGPYQEKYVLVDRKIKTLGILPFNTEPVKITNNISGKFFNLMKNNKSDINISMLENDKNSNLDSILKGEVKEYSSDTKNIIFSDFFEYHILEQQIKIGIEISIVDLKTNDLLWKRKATKYNTQRWIDYHRPRIGTNQVIDAFYIPTQLAVNTKKQFTEEALVDKTISEIIEDLAKNLVKLK